MTLYEVVEEISRNEFHVTFRGLRSADGLACLMKRAWRKPPRGVDVELLKREGDVLRGLRIEGIPRVIDTARLADGDHLILSLGDGAAAAPLPARMDLGLFFEVSTALCGVLADLHRLDVIHGSLNPSSILFDRASGRIMLLDFGMTSRGSGGVGESVPLHLLQEGLSYVSPEQTGRMNRSVDYRSDFYLVGVTLYQLLVGHPPFRSDDPLEVIHQHVARNAVPPDQAAPGIPDQLGAIILKLLAKTAEQRYQSALGLRDDLETCAAEWRRTATVPAFPLARRDVPERFVLSQKLYGRGAEVEKLHELLDSVRGGRSALVLVSGYSGIGKTSLIQELYKPIAAQKGAFVSGKFDQVVRDIPCGALVQALRGLVRQFLAGGEERLAVWRERLGAALGANAGVLAEVLPEIELILGRQARPPDLGPTESRNRFRLVLRNFAGALARADHPLIVFLDDLQWVDAATLDLLDTLLTGPETRFLLLIGAYRDNEVDVTHQLIRCMRGLRDAGARIESISLGPLGERDLSELAADTLHDTPERVRPLAQLVLQKTGGNPFFVNQFFRMLHEGDFLAFDVERRRWTYDVGKLHDTPFSDNVVDLMTGKIQSLPPDTQRILTLAACVGSPFDLGVLAIASGLSISETASRIGRAVEEGLVLKLRSEYQPGAPVLYEFLHDRVQQSAYALIAREDRYLVHLTVGRLLLKQWDETAAEKEGSKVFDILHHLNLGHDLVTDPAERMAIARLNLSAGRRARSATAHREALRYARAGCALLDPSSWQTDHELTLGLHLEAAECEYLCGNFDDAERLLGELLVRSLDRVDAAHVCCLMTRQYENMSRFGDAVRAAREGLMHLGVALPESAAATEAALETEVKSIEQELSGRTIASLVDMPVAGKPEIRSVMRLLTTVWSPAYVSGSTALARLVSAMLVRLSLEHGNTEDSAYGYVTHAITVGPVRGDYQSAYAWGRLALEVNERLRDTTLRAKIHQQFNTHVTLWCRPHATSIIHAREARRSGLESGDFTYAGYGAFTESWAARLTDRDLDEFVRDQTPNLALVERLKMAGVAGIVRAMIQFARALQGLTRDRLSFSDDSFDEDEFLRRNADQPFFLTQFLIMKVQLCVLFDEVAAAREASAQARKVSRALDGTIWPLVLDFYEGLALASTPGPVPGTLTEAHDRLARLAAHCPENFLAWALMLQAEMCRLRQSDAEATRLYEAAVRHARETEDVQNEALANELCARHWLSCGNTRMAGLRLEEARSLYARWGAMAKVRDLEARQAPLLAGAPLSGWRPGVAAGTGTQSPGPPGSSPLDISTFSKAASAIAKEIILDDLLGSLVRIAMENAGAQRGLFIQEVDGHLVLEAEGSVETGRVTLLKSAPLEPGSRLCASVVHFVRKTGEFIVVADAARDDRFSADPYVAAASPRSILCIPVMHQGRFGGILYLENNLGTDAFTAERVRVLQILSSQAAISLQNARLYDEMKQEVARRHLAEEGLRAALVEVERLRDRLRAENVYLQEEIRTEHNFEEMVGTSAALLELLAQVEKVAPTDATVLICGETGTGKELIARALHNHSRRTSRPLAKLNCGAISPGLVESELFGHVKGAFTGALESRTGRFELADGGTLFLDEVGELSPEAQVKLLRVLQEQEFEPVGGSRTVRVDVRIIAATNRDLEEAVRQGRFRADLFFRLNVFPLTVPPLRERATDIPQLAMFFLGKFCRKFGKTIDGISRETMDLLMQYPWPGNVRELQNIIERAVVLAQSRVLVLGRGLLPAMGHSEPSWSRETTAALLEVPQAPRSEAIPLQEMERRHIMATLLKTGGVIEGPKGAAQILNLHPNTLRSRMKKLGIRRTSHDIS